MKRTYCVFNNTRESFLGLNISHTETAIGRMRALAGQFRFRSGGGAWVVPSRWIHTIGMLSPIDVVYLNAARQVIHLVEHMRPFRVAPIRMKSDSVLELPAHTIYGSQTCVGDQLLICRSEEMKEYLKNSTAELALPVAVGEGRNK
jgi:uncharacterized protein